MPKTKSNDRIATGLGEFSKAKFNALLNVRETAMDQIVKFLKREGYTQVTTSTLVNIAGSCENPNASFKVKYYKKEAHLSQSAQLQLEALVIRLHRPVFTVNNSFREENYDDPEMKSRRLSEFTLIEPEKPYESSKPDSVLDRIIWEQTSLIRETTLNVISKCKNDLQLLGGKWDKLEMVAEGSFEVITYNEAIKILNSKGGNYKFGSDLGIREERQLLSNFDNRLTFVTHYPANIKFFNMKRTPDGKSVYSVDTLLPNLGETAGGAVREEDGNIIAKQLNESKLGKFLRKKGFDPSMSFAEYFKVFEQEKPILRGGYWIGFERLIGFLLNSNDILETISYRTLKP